MPQDRRTHRRAISSMATDAMPWEPTFLLHGGRIWTGDAANPWAEALAVKDERILAVGSRQEVEELAGPSTLRIANEGIALPGFIDSHVHFMTGGFPLLSVNLRPASSPVDLASRLEAFAKRLAPGEWITGGDWDHETWPGAELPHRRQIDPVTPKNPVFVRRRGAPPRRPCALHRSRAVGSYRLPRHLLVRGSSNLSSLAPRRNAHRSGLR